jgi:hypothetical protein
MPEFNGKMTGFAMGAIGEPKPRIVLDANSGDITAGGNGAGGDVRVRDDSGSERIRLDAKGAEPVISAEMITFIPVVLGGNGTMRAGGGETDGTLSLHDPSGKLRAKLGAGSSDLWLYNEQGGASAILRASETGMAGLWLGNSGRKGVVVLRDDKGTNRAWLSSDKGQLELFDQAGNRGVLVRAEDQDGRSGVWAGGDGRNGRLVARDAAGQNRVQIDAVDGEVELFDVTGNRCVLIRADEDGGKAGLWAGGSGRDGRIVARNGSGTNRVELDANDGELTVNNANGDSTIRLSGNGASGWFGGHGQAGDLLLFPAGVDNRSTDTASIWVQGDTGDIVLRNADCAEEFAVVPQPGMEAGSVMVLDDDGRLVLCDNPYDSRVAGVVSGAGGVRPGIVLGRVPGARDRLPIALAGKVVCNVDASFGPVRVGDLLTTSPRPGYAMVASDRDRAFGAVIGKAMASLNSDAGRVPVLVCLQ